MFVILFILENVSYDAKDLEGNWVATVTLGKNDPSLNSAIMLLSHDVRCKALTNRNLLCIENNLMYFNMDGNKFPAEEVFVEHVKVGFRQGNKVVSYDGFGDQRRRGTYYGDNKIVYWEQDMEKYIDGEWRNISPTDGEIYNIWTKSGMLCRYVQFRAI